MKLLKSMTGASAETRMILLLWIAMRRVLYMLPPSEYAKSLGVSKRGLMKAVEYLRSEGYIEEVPGLAKGIGKKGGSGYDISYTALQWFEESRTEIFLKGYFDNTLQINKNDSSQRLTLGAQLLLLVLISLSDYFKRIYCLDYNKLKKLTGLDIKSIKKNISILVEEGLLTPLVTSFKPKGHFSIIEPIYELKCDSSISCQINDKPSNYVFYFNRIYSDIGRMIHDLSEIYLLCDKVVNKHNLSERYLDDLLRVITNINIKNRQSQFTGILHCCSEIGYIIKNDKNLMRHMGICYNICIEKYSLFSEPSDDCLIEKIVLFLKCIFPYNGKVDFKPEMFNSIISVYNVNEKHEEFLEQCKKINGLSNMGLFYYLWAESMLPFIKNFSNRISILSKSKSLNVEAIRIVPRVKANINLKSISQKDVTGQEKEQCSAAHGVVEFFSSGTGSINSEYCLYEKVIYENNSRVIVDEQEYEVTIEYS